MHATRHRSTPVISTLVPCSSEHKALRAPAKSRNPEPLGPASKKRLMGVYTTPKVPPSYLGKLTLIKMNSWGNLGGRAKKLLDGLSGARGRATIMHALWGLSDDTNRFLPKSCSLCILLLARHLCWVGPCFQPPKFQTPFDVGRAAMSIHRLCKRI